MTKRKIVKGRGAQGKSHNRFERHIHQTREDYLEYLRFSGEEQKVRTTFTPVHPKTIVNKVTSPDVRMPFSMNPYQGCEHGCVYCYARNTHEYWGYGAGLDFESKILYKPAAATLLEKHLRNPRWRASPIVLSGNTDCYQPAERRFGLTRACLEVFWKYRHPVGIITKNALVLRDLDLLEQLNSEGLVSVHLSVTSLEESVRQILEPRTASTRKRLKTIEVLSQRGIPVNAMLAPMIPGINSHELMDLAKSVADAGALSFGFTLVRLNGAIGPLFLDWLEKAMPQKASRVEALVRSCHGGQLNDSQYGRRMKGDGEVAGQLHQMAAIARRKYFNGREVPALNKDLHAEYKTGQLRLF